MTNTRMYKVYFTQSHEDAKTVFHHLHKNAEENSKMSGVVILKFIM